MKKILFVLIITPFCSSSQSFILTVNNGYGSDTFKSGDTIHVFAREEKPVEIFETWTGDTAYLDDPADWHAVLKMPAKNITINAKFKLLPAGAKLTFERMKGRDTLKPVYYYFPPPGQKVKALVWIYHGSGGNYTSFAEKPEGQTIIKTLVADDYAVAMTECDEATFHKDFDNDGNFRWEYTYNLATGAVSRDMTNQIMIRDTFIKRGYMEKNLPEISLGFSAGGAFSLFNGWILGEKRGVSFCSQGTFVAAEKSTMPSMYFQSYNDNHPDIGKPGNDTAFQNYNKMINRGVCAGFNMFYPWPCYPQYFRRIPGIDSVKSNNIFNELKTMTALTVKNYGRLGPDQIALIIKQQPLKYPAIISLSQDQMEAMDDQIQILLTFHHYHSHFNGKLLRFFNETCGSFTTTYEDIKFQPSFSLFPNPARNVLNVKLPDIKDHQFEICLFDLEGRMIRRVEKSVMNHELITLRLTDMPSGLYLLGIRGDKGYIQVKKTEIH